jgi:hypothetical protein
MDFDHHADDARILIENSKMQLTSNAIVAAAISSLDYYDREVDINDRVDALLRTGQIEKKTREISKAHALTHSRLWGSDDK